jgi:hypothetical protein
LASVEDLGHAAQSAWCPGRPELCVVRYQKGCVLCEVSEAGGGPTPTLKATWVSGAGCAFDCHRSLPVVAVSSPPHLSYIQSPCQA